MTQLDALDDEIFQQIQENGIAYQSLIREVSLLEHRISGMYILLLPYAFGYFNVSNFNSETKAEQRTVYE